MGLSRCIPDIRYVQTKSTMYHTSYICIINRYYRKKTDIFLGIIILLNLFLENIWWWGKSYETKAERDENLKAENRQKRQKFLMIALFKTLDNRRRRQLPLQTLFDEDMIFDDGLLRSRCLFWWFILSLMVIAHARSLHYVMNGLCVFSRTKDAVVVWCY